jgi:hypothetical protein
MKTSKLLHDQIITPLLTTLTLKLSTGNRPVQLDMKEPATFKVQSSRSISIGNQIPVISYQKSKLWELLNF